MAATAGIILEDFDYKVTVVDSPKVALEVLDGEARIDLLSTDLIMPGGMNGVMLARAARERQPKIRVLLTTGYAEASLAHGCGRHRVRRDQQALHAHGTGPERPVGPRRADRRR